MQQPQQFVTGLQIFNENEMAAKFTNYPPRKEPLYIDALIKSIDKINEIN